MLCLKVLNGSASIPVLIIPVTGRLEGFLIFVLKMKSEVMRLCEFCI